MITRILVFKVIVSLTMIKTKSNRVLQSQRSGFILNPMDELSNKDNKPEAESKCLKVFL